MTRIAAVVLGCLLAFAAAQAPEFTQQYRQRLGGALDELRGFVRVFDADARHAGLTREQALAEYAHSGSAFLEVRGARMLALVHRFERLQREQRALRSAAPLFRGLLLARTHDARLLRATAADFSPALPTTAAGAVYGFGGFLGGYLAALALGLVLRRGLAGLRRRSAPAS